MLVDASTLGIVWRLRPGIEISGKQNLYNSSVPIVSSPVPMQRLPHTVEVFGGHLIQ